MDGKTTAIVSHITLIGWVIAFITNNTKKDEFASFYIRQNLGLMILAIALSVLGFIPIIGKIASIVSLGILILWIISIINAVGGKMAPLPVVGQYFQEWFSNIG